MSIEFSNGTSSIVVSYYKDKGTPHSETLTIPATGEYGSHTLTIPATADAAQGDCVLVGSVLAGKTAAVWLDIDAAGTEPTGIYYGNVDYQTEVNIVTGGTAIQNAALVKSAIEAETGLTGLTITDNGDGTLTIDQDVVGWAGDFLTFNADDSGVGSIVAVTDVEGLAGITHGDYVVVENPYGLPLGIWFDVDEDGTPPSGAAFIAAAGDGVTQAIAISTGDTNVENATNVATTISALDWADAVTVTDNEDGTVSLVHTIGGAVTAADPHNADDTSVGSITATTVTAGAAKELKQQVDFAKGAVHITANKALNALIFNTYGDSVGEKGKSSTIYYYQDITVPTSTDIFNLKNQIQAWNVAAGGGSTANIVLNEDAKVSEMTGANDTFTTTYPFAYHSIEVFFNQTKLTLGVDYTEDGAAGEIVLTAILPDATLPVPDTLTFNYIKLQ